VTGARRLRRIAALHGGGVRDKGQLMAERAFRRPHGLAHADPLPDPETVRRAVELGCTFLRRRQARTGAWKGFLLPPGAATSWLTAHVAFVVEDVPELTDACRRAALHLESTGAEDGGWGYNRRVAVDCDSTAQALLVLHRFGRDVPAFLLETLVRAQHRDGGFPTYDTNGAVASGWHTAHPDVTAIAVEMLSRHGRTQSVERASRWLEAQDPAAGFASYWWDGPHYGLWARARAGLLRPAAADAAAAALRETRSAPHVAQAVVAALALRLSEEDVRDAVHQLLRTQLSDGSWPCAPCLRITDPHERLTHPQLRGTCYADGRRIFSTAHAVAALASVRAIETRPFGASAKLRLSRDRGASTGGAHCFRERVDVIGAVVTAAVDEEGGCA